MVPGLRTRGSYCIHCGQRFKRKKTSFSLRQFKAAAVLWARRKEAVVSLPAAYAR